MKTFTRFPSPITAVRSLRLLMPWQNLSVTCKRLTFDHLSWHGWLESHRTLREILDEQLACYITSSGGAWHVLIGHRYCARKTFDEADFIKMRERKKNRQTDRRTGGGSFWKDSSYSGRWAPETPSTSRVMFIQHNVLLLSLFLHSLIVILLFQIPHRRPAALLKIQLVLCSHTHEQHT